jgi:hypothetical protein
MTYDMYMVKLQLRLLIYHMLYHYSYKVIIIGEYIWLQI